MQESTNSVLSTLEKRAEEKIERMLESHPFLQPFHSGTATHAQLYRRHMVEAALRIRMNNAVDSYALSTAIQDDPIAENLLVYLHEEYGHDRMLEEDVRAMGMSEAELAETKPLFATDLLIAFLWRSVEQHGMLPALVWDWLVEWYSPRYNPQITNAAEAEFGSGSVRQATRHLELDQELEHEDALTRAVVAVIERDGSLSKAEQYIDRFVRLIELYFHELLAEVGL
jgi:pyrroloquinoline quinone (PQQ) biosynthesis protein C